MQGRDSGTYFELKIFTLIDDVNVDGFPPPTSEDGVFPSDFLLGSLKMFSQRQILYIKSDEL